MIWVYWLGGALWVADGFLCFSFPSLVRNIHVRAYREARAMTASAGPALLAACLLAASFTASAAAPWTLRGLAAFSFVQAVYLYRAIRTTSPRVIEFVIALPDGAYRLWGLFLTALGLSLIHLRP